jgi:hypothetical protein
MVPAIQPLSTQFMEHKRRNPFDLRASERRYPSEAEIVEATVAFTNGATLEVGQLDPPSAREIAEWEEGLKFWSVQINLLREEGLLESNALDAPQKRDLESRYRAVYRALISAYLRNPEAVDAQFISQGLSSEILGRTLWMPTENGMSIVHHYQLFTFVDVISLGKSLLMDRARGFAQTLCQCQLSNCGKFFFIEKRATGRPATRYCKKSHMLKAHKLNAPSRMKRMRSEPKPRGKK